MGMMVMAESFDEWATAKVQNGYHTVFGEWAEKDIVNLVRHFRNNPSVVMWCIGNEVPDQWAGDKGPKLSLWLQNICHRERPHSSRHARHGCPGRRSQQQHGGSHGRTGIQLPPVQIYRKLQKTPPRNHFGKRNGIDHQFAGSLQIPGSTTVHAQIPRPPVLLLRCGTLRVVQSSRR